MAVRVLAPAVVLGLVASGAAGGPAALERVAFTEPHMGTMARIVLYAPDEARARRGARAAFARIAALDRTLSDYRPDSELSRLGARAGTGAVAVSDDLLRVLDASDRLARETAGAFDVTVGPLSVLWRRARDQGRLPPPRTLEAAHARVGYRHVALDRAEGTVALAVPGMQLDLGGIGKGFAVDEALTVLRAHGLSRALVALGGDIAAGDPPPGQPGWTVEIDVPGRQRRARACSPVPVSGSERCPRLLLHDRAVSTSGDAEQFVVIDGVRYAHIVDPRTGLGLTPSRQATVVAPTAMETDGLATAVVVLGAQRGLALVERRPDAAALVVTGTGDGREVRASARWRATACPSYASPDAPPP